MRPCLLHPPARQVGHSRHLSSPVRGHSSPSLAACSAGVMGLENLGAPALPVPTLDIEPFKDLSFDFHLKMEWRKEASKVLASSGSPGRAGAPKTAMIAGVVFLPSPASRGRLGGVLQGSDGRLAQMVVPLEGVGRCSVGVVQGRPGGCRPGD